MYTLLTLRNQQIKYFPYLYIEVKTKYGFNESLNISQKLLSLYILMWLLQKCNLTMSTYWCEALWGYIDVGFYLDMRDIAEQVLSKLSFTETILAVRETESNVRGRYLQ